jgi:survival-of-motor-neuron-related-splicing factor 30
LFVLAKTKKDLTLAQREYKKKKAQKKAQRLKQHEDEREQDKNKWLSFNSKVFSKTNKGKVKKSIFASPEVGVGKVGVGTCGVSGRPMTKFTHTEKHWKK